MKTNKIGFCSWLFVIFALIWLWQLFVKSFFQSGPGGYVGLLLVVAAIAFFVWWRRGEKAKNNKLQLARMADQCDALVRNMGQISSSGLALKSGEVAVCQLSQVGLLEFVSDGSSYKGMNNGVGLRVTNGITWNVSGSSGQLIRNPETEQIVDSGTVIFTNKRVLFAGTKFTREWNFDKMVNLQTSANGASVHMNVTGQSKVSGLTYTNASELTPGIVLSVAQAYSTGGQIAAERLAKTYAMQFRDIKD
jgi:hypothetical protein